MVELDPKYPYPIPAAELERRFLRLHSPAISDCLDRLGHRAHVLPVEVRPLDPKMKLAGPIFTARGEATKEDKEEFIQFAFQGYSQMIAMPRPVIVIDSSGDRTSSHWGELLSNAAKAIGAAGTVAVGGVRDVDRILPLGYPVFAAFTTPADIRGRWRYVDFACPLRFGEVVVRPWDYLLGDMNGIAVVPRELVVPVLEAAEKVIDTEEEIRAELQAGNNPLEVYAKYGAF